MTDFRALPGIADDVLDRAPLKPEYDRVYYREGKISQASELNESITRQDDKRRRVGDLVARDGDRIEGCDIVTIDIATGTYSVAAGKVYVRGDVRAVAEATLVGVGTAGDVQVGVRLVETIVDHEDDPDLLGQYEGSASEGEAGGLRVSITVEWGWSGDGQPGALYAVYSLRDGAVTDQAPPPELSGVSQIVAAYDYGAHENYIDDGCFVTCLGKTGDDQVFTVGEGIANILGFKRYRKTATRYTLTEEPDIEQVDAEPHILADAGGTAVIKTNHAPINGVVTAIIEKEYSETINRGAVADTADLLSKSAVTEVVSVTQGATTYLSPADYLSTGDTIDWSPGGGEPAGGSSYDVTYRYLEAVAPTEITDTTITVADGVDGGQAFVTYTFKLPRIDRICLDRDGNIAYLKGVAAREQPLAPSVPQTLLALCEVRNDWFSDPEIVNNGIRNYPFWMIDRIYNRVVDLLDLVSLERLRRDISAREPTAKHEVFVDPFTSDRYRDAGEAQDAAVFDGTCQIAIDPAFTMLSLDAPAMLQFATEVIVRQDFVTGCMKINPYQVFQPVPITLTISPSEDFWEETNTTWLSPVTRIFGQSSTSRSFSSLNDGVSTSQWQTVSTDIIETASTREASFLRQIPISFTVGNLGEGETVDLLTFDGVDVDPGGLAGDVSGVASGEFVIPANIATGVKEVLVQSGSGATGAARFEGRGIITDVTRQQVTTVVERTKQDTGSLRDGSVVVDVDGDPLAQTIMLKEDRHIAAIEVKFCAIGDRSKPVICEIVEVDNGVPTTNVIAQTEVDMEGVVTGAFTRFSFAAPPFIPASIERAFVFKTDDGAHSLAIAQRGGFDETSQQWVGAQPYTVGVLLSSSNATTWTPHQDSDLTMRVYGAVFGPTERTVNLGVVAVEDLSDMICAANIMLPTDQTTLRFRVTPDGGPAQILENNQNWERTSFFTGNVTVEAMLSGSAKVSPILGRDTLAIAGTMRTTGTYVSRTFSMGTDVRQDTRIKARIPTGASLALYVDKGDDDWQAMALQSADLMSDGSYDQLYRKDAWTAAAGGRIKIVMTGGPAARPSLTDLRSFSI